jgi:hypothetical protein
MADLDDFELRLKEAADKLGEIDKSEPIRVISHLDSDGICAASLLLKALSLDKRKYTVSIVQQLDEKTIKAIAAENYRYIFFTDIGSGQLDLIMPASKTYNIHTDTMSLRKMQPKRNPCQSHRAILTAQPAERAGVVYLFSGEAQPEMRALPM